jgi:hypothetical protein
MPIHPLAGKLASHALLADIGSKLMATTWHFNAGAGL